MMAKIVQGLLQGVLGALWNALAEPLRRWLRDREVRQHTEAETRYKEDEAIIKAVRESQNAARNIESKPDAALSDLNRRLNKLREHKRSLRE